MGSARPPPHRPPRHPATRARATEDQYLDTNYRAQFLYLYVIRVMLKLNVLKFLNIPKLPTFVMTIDVFRSARFIESMHVLIIARKGRVGHLRPTVIGARNRSSRVHSDLFSCDL